MRSDTLAMIADNPVSITISRKTWTVANGKRSSSSSTLAAQTVRLYNAKGPRTRAGDENRFDWQRELKMLCAYDANVKSHTNENDDKFTVDGVTYLIRDVNAVKWNGLVISKQCFLEELHA